MTLCLSALLPTMAVAARGDEAPPPARRTVQVVTEAPDPADDGDDDAVQVRRVVRLRDGSGFRMNAPEGARVRVKVRKGADCGLDTPEGARVRVRLSDGADCRMNMRGGQGCRMEGEQENEDGTGCCSQHRTFMFRRMDRRGDMECCEGMQGGRGFRRGGPHRQGRVEFLMRGGYALADQHRDAIGADGYYHRDDLQGGFTGELGFRYWMARGLAIGLTAGYTDLGRAGDGQYAVPMRTDENGNVIYTPAKAPRLTAFPVNAVLTCRLPIRSCVRPYAEIGAGIAVVRGEEPVYYDYPVAEGQAGSGTGIDPYPDYYYGTGRTNQSVRFDCLGGAGLELRAGRMAFTVGARYTAIDTHGDALNHASFLAGIALH
jgi:hypothetical protein